MSPVKKLQDLKLAAIKVGASAQFISGIDNSISALNTNSTVDDRERRKKLRCSLCPPNRKENAKRKPKHGVKKPKKP